jgi:cytochrome c-type biogenesis protein CcmH/NrfF
MNPNNPPLDGDTNLLIWGITFGVLIVAAIALALMNREQ